jgi:hypothetical protein
VAGEMEGKRHEEVGKSHGGNQRWWAIQICAIRHVDTDASRKQAEDCAFVEFLLNDLWRQPRSAASCQDTVVVGRKTSVSKTDKWKWE